MSSSLTHSGGSGSVLLEAPPSCVLRVANLGGLRMHGKGSNPQASDSADSSSSVSPPLPEGRNWPARLQGICRELLSARDDSSRDKAQGEAWELLNSVISLYLRYHAAKLGKVTREDMEDIAAEKSLDLLHRIESGKTDFSNPTPSEIASFLSKVARNALLDLLRKSRRRVEPREDDRPERDVLETGEGRAVEGETMSATDGPDLLVERKEFAEALRRCAERLDPRSRLVWFLRLFCEMPSKQIAVHPEVCLTVNHVDVLLKRSREAIRDCMRQQDYEPHEMPPGTFFELWRAFRFQEA